VQRLQVHNAMYGRPQGPYYFCLVSLKKQKNIRPDRMFLKELLCVKNYKCSENTGNYQK